MSRPAVIFACGGGCRETADMIASDTDFPIVTINAEKADIVAAPADGASGFGGNASDAYREIRYAHGDEIMDRIRGHPVVVGFAALGGGTGEGGLAAVGECARSMGSSFISMVILPSSTLENEERRERALGNLPEVQSFSDRTFVIDLQKALPYGSSDDVVTFMRESEVLKKHAVTAIAEMAGSTPFMSLFTAKCYTLSYQSEATFADSAVAAMETPLSEADPKGKRLVIFADSKAGDREREAAADAVAGLTGVYPDFVQGTMPEGKGTFVFTPISCRLSDSSE